ncbi:MULTISPECIES: hypothetical protein [Methylomonas]|uniref:hypothetical protein n=1 Tax=Methylomonas TaxID=416 RepID=UPI001681905E|nr:hypothetical protein [Methylomonas rhizoryzae]
MFRTLLASACLALLSGQASAALTSGDLAFTAFNADEDGWAMTTFVDIAADTTIFFSDNEWNGSSFNSGESFHSWHTGNNAISAGTVIRFSNIDQAGRSVSVGTLSGSGSNFGISATSETLYAYLGSDYSTPGIFLTAISSEGDVNIVPTGLSAGVNAVVLTDSSDYAEYIGPRSGLSEFADYAALVNDAANWSILVGGDQSLQTPDTASFSVAPASVPLPGTIWLFGSVCAGLAAMRSHNSRLIVKASDRCVASAGR